MSEPLVDSCLVMAIVRVYTIFRGLQGRVILILNLFCVEVQPVAYYFTVFNCTMYLPLVCCNVY